MSEQNGQQWQSWRQSSRDNWGSNLPHDAERIAAGALCRIADALEKLVAHFCPTPQPQQPREPTEEEKEQDRIFHQWRRLERDAAITLHMRFPVRPPSRLACGLEGACNDRVDDRIWMHGSLDDVLKLRSEPPTEEYRSALMEWARTVELSSLRWKGITQVKTSEWIVATFPQWFSTLEPATAEEVPHDADANP